MRCYQKVSEIRLPDLNYLLKFVFASISLELATFFINGMMSVGFPRSEVLLEAILREDLRHFLHFVPDLFNAQNVAPLNLNFIFGNKNKSQGSKSDE
jgi:hypothetical protein